MKPVERATAMGRAPVWRTLLRTSVVVLAAGFAAGWVAEMPLVGAPAAGETPALPGIVDTLGKAFVDTRIVTLFVLALPAIGVCERFGLQAHARNIVRRVPAATVGRLQFVYHLFRIGVVSLGIRLGSGHVTFSRPLIVPMALGAAGLEPEDTSTESERIKGLSGASENFANFFGQNLFFGSAGVALIVKSLETAGYPVPAESVALATIPMAVASLATATGEYFLFDLWLRARAARQA